MRTSAEWALQGMLTMIREKLASVVLALAAGALTFPAHAESGWIS